VERVLGLNGLKGIKLIEEHLMTNTKMLEQLGVLSVPKKK
jgi:hypothetical protein